ncbi:PREDICTED: cyclin-dependent kinase inhibitor 1 isoform X1 [Nicotiana attenuata]|uniref:Cyclin-dependent kinase inhibitor 1 n=1 Tax=Nicotiana attenuata TaxID=49451 RepID=A0A314KGZ9_NICAT|nr:PREDICTED: cyclin-dependent kinase inhibitor 1 isoform X1 [Nicotiana attenuata]OIT28532.1 cyclin-dependent kinase inhibitor 1 [Nicotiana attenuata]
MGRYMRKCKGIGEVTIMDVSDDVDLDVPTMTTKKRKLSSDGDVKLISPALLRCRSQSGVGDAQAGSLVSPASSVNLNDASNLDQDLASCCSRNGSTEVTKSNAKSLDLNENNVVASAESKEEKLSSERQRTPEKMPSEKEIEDFFAVRKKTIFKRFREKYNFDFEKEEPLEGRYEWVRIAS